MGKKQVQGERRRGGRLKRSIIHKERRHLPIAALEQAAARGRLARAHCRPTVSQQESCSPAPRLVRETGKYFDFTVVPRPGIGRYVKYRNFNESWASTRSVYAYLSGDVGVCSRRGTRRLSLGSWII